MKRLQILRVAILAFVVISFGTSAFARYPDGFKKVVEGNTPLSTRADCVQGASRFDMDINNVRCALLSSGDVWWDLDNGVYIVPKVAPGTGAKAVSAIFAGAVWLGGKDPSGNLKVAAQTYRTGTRTDFWPGPLKDATGLTDAETCEKWDKHFVVTATEIDSALKIFRDAKAKNAPVDCGLIPESIKGWPSQGNANFFDVHRFALPKTTQGLAKFRDENGDGIYDPCAGDYPIIDVKGCESITAVPDQMVFWIYNDAGGVHTQSSRSQQIQMEVQVQAFAYKTNDELNDMTFQRYKLINRAKTDIDSMYFAMWADPDLGCYTDDYVGCDTARSLMYVYNQDAVDGTNGVVCDGGVNTYGDKIPILGVDYFRGPNDQNGKELGMSSFTYYLNPTTCNPLPGTTDPSTAVEFYNYLTGKWRDGTPFTFGGSAYNPGSRQTIKYAFIDAPNNPSGWSMCTQNLPCGDRRTLQATGPLTLKPGRVNELIVGVPFVADQAYPCPDIRRLQEADDIAQALFDNCFKIFDGPDAPDVNFVELDKEIVAVFSNAPESNNANEQYFEKGLKIPAKIRDSVYRFQGYKFYQLHDGDVGVADLDNPEKSRLIGQVDLQDTVGKIYNWLPTPDPNFGGRNIFNPILKVDAENQGIRHTFRIREDRFATSEDKRLVNHKKYYFIAVAYAYNNYEKFDEKKEQGQKDPFAVGRRNIGDKNRGGKPYEVIPRPIVDVNLQSKYGDGPIITRLDGVGTGANFLDMSEETRNKIMTGGFDGTIVYKPGRGPIAVKIYNPIEVVDGQYTLSFKDSNQNDDVLDKNARWELKNTATNDLIAADRTLEQLNEQIIAKFGFSVTLGQVNDAGTTPTVDKTNGAIGSEVTYTDNTKPWLIGIPDDQPLFPGLDVLNYVKNQVNEPDFDLDPKQALSKVSQIFTPYYLCDYVYRNTPQLPTMSPAWHNTTSASVRTGNSLANLNNVDIIFTKDKSKWSRCVVIETASPWFYTEPQGPKVRTVGNAEMFSLRKSPSVGKDAEANGLPKADGDGEGMGWFPGYAIDVETGKRVNIFFGENSAYDPELGQYTPESKGNGRDMMWNPSSQQILPTAFGGDPQYNAFFGGHHFIYVTNTDYDACAALRTSLTGANFRKIAPLRTITWAAMPFLLPNAKLLPYKDGLIPNDATVKLRVNNAYAPNKGKGTNGNHPAYTFKLENRQAKELTTQGIDSSLNMINVVPNPYYGYSAYEINEFSTTVKITNLPAKSTVTIHTVDGRFIRQFKRDERPGVLNTKANPGILAKQIAPAVEWDMKNDKGIPVASGVYLIHIDSPEGTRTLKFFAVNRQFDPSRL
jgi:hypothetical protein